MNAGEMGGARGGRSYPVTNLARCFVSLCNCDKPGAVEVRSVWEADAVEESRMQETAVMASWHSAEIRI